MFVLFHFLEKLYHLEASRFICKRFRRQHNFLTNEKIKSSGQRRDLNSLISQGPTVLKITCPGVWLCSDGLLEATIKTLGYFFKTGTMEPKFPALCHDQFTMEGYFKSVKCISQLERVLGDENIEINLWQNGRRLAYFSGKLNEVMHPHIPTISCVHNVNVQILMHPSQAFPGIIAPKLEISINITVKDKNGTLSTYTGEDTSSNSVMLSSLNREIRRSSHSHENINKIVDHRKQKSVCHTRNKSLLVKPSSETSSSTKFSHGRVSSCSSPATGNSYSIMSDSELSALTSNFSCPSSISATQSDDHQRRCPICVSYKKAFQPLDNL